VEVVNIVSDDVRAMPVLSGTSGEQSESGQDGGEEREKGESLEEESKSLKALPDKEGEGEGINVDNLKTKEKKRQHSRTSILKTSIEVTKTVRELVD
jgi:hypothetical protein